MLGVVSDYVLVDASLRFANIDNPNITTIQIRETRVIH